MNDASVGGNCVKSCRVMAVRNGVTQCDAWGLQHLEEGAETILVRERALLSEYRHCRMIFPRGSLQEK
jgi:hypothetical protein